MLTKSAPVTEDLRVALITLWLFYDIKPSRAELVGIILCNLGLAISVLGRTEQGAYLP
ncbi:MAG: hypothetical protein WCO26_21240 [Deltaproteobacteria bacterium]